MPHHPLQLCSPARWPVALLAVLLAAGTLFADDWPEWRGKGRRGVWTETGIIDKFPEAGLTAGWRTPLGQDFLLGRPGAYTIADYRLRCNGFRTAARFGTPFAAAPAFACWPIMAFQRSQRAL